jgi:uncharacterized protein
MKYFPLITLFALLAACNPSGNNQTDDFDRRAMLQHYADNLIRSAYAALQQEVAALGATQTAFNAAPTAPNLTALRTAWQKAFIAWQSANAFNFGPAGEEGVRKGLVEEIGTFPANREKIEQFVRDNDASFNNFNRDTRGFLAIEYLLFDGSEASVLSALQGSTNRRAYLNAAIGHLQQQVGNVVSAWATYRDPFVANNGTDVGSATALLYNEFVRSYESAKNFKTGLPLGKRPGQTKPEPQLVEAFYSGQSLAALKAHLAAIEKIYYGRTPSGQDGPGFKEYLDKVTGGPELVRATEAQWLAVQNALNAVPTDQPLSALMAQNHPAVEALHTELQKHTRFFKSDMSSLLGIAITFNSGDGD